MKDDERRVHRRLDLEPLGICMAKDDRGCESMFTPYNIGVGGVMLELVASKAPGALSLGRTFTFSECPESVSMMLDGVTGEVVWRAGELVGVKFDKLLEISADELYEYVRTNSRMPWNE